MSTPSEDTRAALETAARALTDLLDDNEGYTINTSLAVSGITVYVYVRVIGKAA